MTTATTPPAFNHLIAIDTPTAKERNPQMTATALGIEYHQNQLRQVANDLRNERILGATSADGPNRLRIVVGEALVNLGTTLASRPRTSVQAR
ncbi:MAG TPA: hypothetical protein VKR30_09585 [Candidatus Limnocylindrales bacterium]|nr:hypothetical protein [Candidatus Limnocylindrales bacterium]